MAASDNPGFLFRMTSLTIRLRFTPAMACSTRTRMADSLRLTRFSRSVSAPPRGFFFRLPRLADRRLVPLEPRVLVQHRPRPAPAGLTRGGLVGRVGPAVGRLESGQQVAELRVG